MAASACIRFIALPTTDSASLRKASPSPARLDPCHVEAIATNPIFCAFFMLMPGSPRPASLLRPAAARAPRLSPHASAKSPSCTDSPPPPSPCPDSPHERVPPPQASPGRAASFRTHANLADQCGVPARCASPRETFLPHTSLLPAHAPSTFLLVLPSALPTPAPGCGLPGIPIRTPPHAPPSAPAVLASR